MSLKLLIPVLFLLVIGLASSSSTEKETKALEKKSSVLTSLVSVPVILWELVEYIIRGFFVTIFGVSPQFGGFGKSEYAKHLDDDHVGEGDGASADSAPASFAAPMAAPMSAAPKKRPSLRSIIGKIFVGVWNFIDTTVRNFLESVFGAKFS